MASVDEKAGEKATPEQVTSFYHPHDTPLNLTHSVPPANGEEGGWGVSEHHRKPLRRHLSDRRASSPFLLRLEASRLAKSAVVKSSAGAQAKLNIVSAARNHFQSGLHDNLYAITRIEAAGAEFTKNPAPMETHHSRMQGLCECTCKHKVRISDPTNNHPAIAAEDGKQV